MALPAEVVAPRLLIGAGVLLVMPLVAAQDPQGNTKQARALRHIVNSIWREVTSSSTTRSDVWSDLLAQLSSAFEDYVDVSPSGEDFLAKAADQVGTSLELLASGSNDSAKAWALLASKFNALDYHLRSAHQDEFFGAWLSALRTELAALADSGTSSAGAIRRRIEQAVSDAMPMIDLAYRTSTDTSDWDYDI